MHKSFKKLAIIALSAMLMGCATNPGTDEPVRRPGTEAATPEPTTAPELTTAPEPTTVPEPTQATEISKKGCETWNELVGMYLDWMNGNISNQEFLQSFDETVCCAVLMLNEEPSYSDLTIEQAYQLIETQGGQPDEDILAYLTMIENAVPGLEAELDEIKAEINRLNGAQTSIHSDNLKEQRGGYWNYVVETPATEAGGSVFRLVFAKRDGIFYWGTISAAKSAVREEPTPTPAVENQQKGCETKEELVGKYLEWLNGDLSGAEFLAYFDEEVYLAYWLTEDYYSIAPTMEEAYGVLEDKENQPESIQKLLNKEAGIVEQYASEIDAIYVRMSSYQTHETEVNPDYFWQSKVGYVRYVIPVEDEEIRSIGIYMAERDGRFYWAEIYRTMR